MVQQNLYAGGTALGPFMLPDRAGALVRYNGIVFGPLIKSSCTGDPVIDDAGRTTKYVKIRVEIDGYVTAAIGLLTIDSQMVSIRQALEQQGGRLTYQGKGFGPLDVNGPGGLPDVRWGPVPTLMEFIPLGGAGSAKIKWTCECYVAFSAVQSAVLSTARGSLGQPCQWNYGATLSYKEDGYAEIVLKGVIEIPASRSVIGDRSVPALVDQYRGLWLNVQLDPDFFRETNRSFDYSRDKRTCEWTVEGEELPPMALPVGCNVARGTLSVREINVGGTEGGIFSTAALTQWIVNLEATYLVRKDYPRRQAYWDFMLLAMFRMNSSANGILPGAANVGAVNPARFQVPADDGATLTTQPAFQKANQLQQADQMNCFPIGFRFREGLYLDSKTITFEIEWYLITELQGLLMATGVWFPTPGQGGQEWKASAGAFFGSRSWLGSFLDPNADVIVDLSGGGPPATNVPVVPAYWGPQGALVPPERLPPAGGKVNRPGFGAQPGGPVGGGLIP